MKFKKFFGALSIVFTAVFSVYAIFCCINLFGNGGDPGIINGIIVICLWFAICAVPVLFFTGKFDRALGKFSAPEESYDEAIQKRNRLKIILPVFIIVLAVSLGLLAYSIVLAVKSTGEDFIRCEAILTENGCKYYDLAGNLYSAKSNSIWNGVDFEIGKTIFIYYEVLNPDNAIFPADTVMMFVVCWFFLLTDAIILASAFRRFAPIIPILAGLMFTVLAVCVQVAISLAGGLSFLSTIFSGATAYFMNVLLVLGAYALIFGLAKTFISKK